ncbi:hypothetical protein GE09DRAFT_1223219 [Coniochaeta sp. 2T2.1]|nr:hypothetical protein GE09DRAFT_1223219 [Coniochaeta sp. 2T2.1]
MARTFSSTLEFLSLYTTLLCSTHRYAHFHLHANLALTFEAFELSHRYTPVYLGPANRISPSPSSTRSSLNASMQSAGQDVPAAGLVALEAAQVGTKGERREDEAANQATAVQAAESIPTDGQPGVCDFVAPPKAATPDQLHGRLRIPSSDEDGSGDKKSKTKNKKHGRPTGSKTKDKTCFFRGIRLTTKYFDTTEGAILALARRNDFRRGPPYSGGDIVAMSLRTVLFSRDCPKDSGSGEKICYNCGGGDTSRETAQEAPVAECYKCEGGWVAG